MPRKKRKEQKVQVVQSRRPEREQTFSSLSSGQSETIRFHCPLCGMMADLARLDAAPYAMDFWRQVFGGEHIVSERKVKDKGRGSIAYFTLEDEELETETREKISRILPMIAGSGEVLPLEEEEEVPLLEAFNGEEQTLENLIDKWSNAKARNSALALKDLQKLTETDTSSAVDALDEYRDLQKSDFEDQEEYQEAKDEAWENFLAALRELEPGNLLEA